MFTVREGKVVTHEGELGVAGEEGIYHAAVFLRVYGASGVDQAAPGANSGRGLL